MKVAVEIPDEIGRALAGQTGVISRIVLEAVAVKAYRMGAITPAQVQQMLGFRSRCGFANLSWPRRDSLIWPHLRA